VRVTADAGAMRVEDLPAQRFPAGGLKLALSAPANGHLAQAFACRDPEQPAQQHTLDAIAFLDAAGRGVVLSAQGGRQTLDAVQAMHSIQGMSGPALHLVRPAGTEKAVRQGVHTHSAPPDTTRAVLGAGRGGRVVVAHERGEGWMLPETVHEDARIAVPAGAEVLGTTGVPGPPERSALLVLLADRLTLVAWSREGPAPRLTLPTPAVSAGATVRGDRVAFVHDDHSVTVWSLPTGRCLLSYGCRP